MIPFGSRHPLTAAVHKWSYKMEETLSLCPHQVYGSGCSCPPSPTSLSRVTTGLKIVWHLKETTRSSAKMLGGAGHHEDRALSFWCLECCDRLVSMEGATSRRWANVERERGLALVLGFDLGCDEKWYYNTAILRYQLSGSDVCMTYHLLCQEHWTVNNPLQNTIILLLEQIVGALGTDFKLYLPCIVPHILRVFLHDATPGRTTTAKVWRYYNFTSVECMCRGSFHSTHYSHFGDGLSY